MAASTAGLADLVPRVEGCQERVKMDYQVEILVRDGVRTILCVRFGITRYIPRNMKLSDVEANCQARQDGHYHIGRVCIP